MGKADTCTLACITAQACNTGGSIGQPKTLRGRNSLVPQDGTIGHATGGTSRCQAWHKVSPYGVLCTTQLSVLECASCSGMVSTEYTAVPMLQMHAHIGPYDSSSYATLGICSS